MFTDFVMPEGFWFFVSMALLISSWPFWGPRISGFFHRLDEKRRDAELQAYYDRMNPNAHFRQTVDAFNEETPAVEPFAKARGADDPRAIWKDQIFPTREAADAARWRHVLTKARDFYTHLDRLQGHSVRGRRGQKIGSSADDEGNR
jgi:hypothetical protein